MDYAPDGELSRYADDDIADAIMWDGPSETVCEAMREARFIDRDNNRIHDWHDYVGALLERRQKNAERKRKSRARHAPVTQTGEERTSDGKVMGDVSHGATEPNLTEPNQTKPKDKEPSSRQRKTYAEDSRPFKLAVYIRDRIQGVANELGRPHLIRNPNMQKWADTCRLLLENDKRDPHEVRDVIDWVSKHHFWQTNILSPESLRNKYADLCLKMAADKKGPTPKSGSGAGRQQEEGRTRSGKPNLPVVDRQTGPTLTPQEEAEMMERARRLRDDDRPSPTPEEREQARAIARRMKEDAEKLRLPLG